MDDPTKIIEAMAEAICDSRHFKGFWREASSTDEKEICRKYSLAAFNAIRRACPSVAHEVVFEQGIYDRGRADSGEKAREAMAQLGMEVHKLASEALTRIDVLKEWGADLAISNEDGVTWFTQPRDLQGFDPRMGAAELMLKALNDPNMTLKDCVAVLIRGGKGMG